MATKTAKQPKEMGFRDVLADPCVREVYLPGGPVGIFAPHGGGIEPGTEEIARAVAQSTGATLYVLSAKRPTANGALHVCSTKMPTGVSAKLDAAIKGCRLAISIHGHGRTKDGGAIYVSGTAAKAIKVAAESMRSAVGAHWPVIEDPKKIPADLAGTSKDNFVNRPKDGGFQIELPRALRDEARPAIRGAAVDLVRALVEVVRALS